MVVMPIWHPTLQVQVADLALIFIARFSKLVYFLARKNQVFELKMRLSLEYDDRMFFCSYLYCHHGWQGDLWSEEQRVYRAQDQCRQDERAGQHHQQVQLSR
jgi:hypothetical protein